MQVSLETVIIKEVAMRDFKIMFLLVALFFLVSASFAYADEISDLRIQMQDMQYKMGAMQKKIDALEAKGKTVRASETIELQKTAVEKLTKIEEDVAYLQQQNNDFLGKLKDMLKVNLYTTLEFEHFQRRHSQFDARNVELLIRGQLTDRLKSFAEIEYERTAKTSANSTGSSRQGEVEVEQGWIEYAINQYLNLRGGVILVPFGKFNLTHFDSLQELTDRPIAMRRVVPTTWAEAGVGFTGEAFLGEKLGTSLLTHLNLNYQLFVINGLINAITDTGIRDARGGFGSDNNNNKAVVGRLGISPFSSTEIGLSGYGGVYDTKGHRINGFDTDFNISKGPFQLLGEYAIFSVDENGLQTDNATLVSKALRGGYIQANYRFWFERLNKTFLGRGFEHPTFTAILSYGQADIDDDGDAGTGSNREDRWTIGLNYRPVETYVFKLEYQYNKTKSEALEYGDSNGVVASVTAAF